MRPLMKHNGFTLVELLLSMVFGLIVLAGVTTIYVSVVGSSGSTLKESKLSTQLMTIMSVMTNDIRRAGYWGTFTETPSSNPFSVPNDSALAVFNSISANTVIAENSNVDGECIVFAYDADNDGELDSDSEFFGYRLNGSVIEMRTPGTVANADSCSESDGDWQEISDAELYRVTRLSFNPQNSECVNTREPDEIDNDGANGIDDTAEIDCYAQIPTVGSGDTTVETREIIITLAAILNSDSEVTYTIQQSVKVRNDMVRIR